MPTCAAAWAPFCLLLLKAASLIGETTSLAGLESEPLAERSRAEPGASLFTELDPSVIGLGAFENSYRSESVWKERWMEYLLGTIGTGIALGDVDGDGYPDLFVASKDERSRLYRNVDGERFEDLSDASGFVDSSHPASGCAMIDVDNDGDLDLYLCHVGGPNELWINDGSGAFAEQGERWGVDVASGSTAGSFADYDRDGDLDLYLQRNLLHEGSSFGILEDMLFENRGGRFVEVTTEAGVAGPGHGHAAVWWDYNQDGWPDIYVANDFAEADKLYRNNGDGTFTDTLPDVANQIPYYSMGADFGDIDNDGRPDLWASDMAATQRAHHMRTVGTHRHVYENSSSSGLNQSLKNALLLNLGDGRFADVAYLSGLERTDWTWSARLVDLDNDGWLDAFATNGMLRSFHDGDLGNLQMRYRRADWMRIVFRSQPVLRERNLAFENLEGLRFREREDWGLGKLGVSFGAAFGDIDLDGDLDLVCNNFEEPPSVFRNDESEANRIVIRLVGVESNRFGLGAKARVVAGSLSQEKELSSMRGYMSTDEPILHFGLGQRSEIDVLEVRWPSGAVQRYEGLPANRRYRVEERPEARSAPQKAETAALFRQADYAFPEEAGRSEAYFDDFAAQPLLPYPESRRGGLVAAGDVDGDGRVDLLLSGATGQPTVLLRQAEGRRFESSAVYDFEDDFGSEDTVLRLLDFDGDGDLDLLVASGGVELKDGDPFYQDRLYLNDAAGNFERDWTFELSKLASPTQTLAAADFDGDGDWDVFTGGLTRPGIYPHAVESRLWINEDGGLQPSDAGGALRGIGRVSDARWDDYEGDGDLDLFLAREWAAPALLRNDEGSLSLVPHAFDEEAVSGWWSAMVVADFDGDGRLDLAVGNHGLNSGYEASQEEPMRLYYTAREQGPPKLLESEFDAGEEWPREEKWRLELDFPDRIRSVDTYEAFAALRLRDLFPEVDGDGFSMLQQTELRSGVFWQSEEGQFRFEAFPDFAQTGRVTGLVARDLTGDGFPDLCLALEFTSPEAWSGRFEKGHLALLLNRGGRVFEALRPGESGLSLDGSPRGLAWADLDGDASPDLIVSRSEGLPVVFELRTRALDE